MGALKNLGVESVRVATRMQDLHLTFRAIEGSATAANRTLGFLFATAQRLGVDFTVLASSFKNFEAAAKGTSLEGTRAQAIFVAMAEGARALGVSGEPLQRVFAALQQSLSKGKISMEEWRQQLSESLPGAMQLTARGLGITTQLFEQMALTGILPVEAAMVGLATEMQKLGGSGAQSDVQRLSSTFAQLRNETVAWLAALGQGIGDTIQPWIAHITTLSAKLRELFDIRAPGQVRTPGASSGGTGLSLAPRSTGFLPPNPGMPSEFEAGSTANPLSTPAATLFPFISSPFNELIRAAAAQHKEDAGLVSQIIKAESAFNPNAVSRRGAVGLMQLMEGTGRDMGLQTPAEFLNPSQNIQAGTQYLGVLRTMLTKEFGKLEDETRLILAAYNAGPGNVIRALKQVVSTGGAPTFANIAGILPQPQTTGSYVTSIFGAGPQGKAPALPPALGFIQDTIEKTQAQIPELLTQMQALSASSLNFGGVLGSNVRKQAEEVETKFQGIAELLGRFPALAAQLTPVQRAQLEETAKLVATMRERVDAETQGGAAAQKTVQTYREAQQAVEQLAEKREAALSKVVQGEKFTVRDPSLLAITADLEHYNALLTTETGPRLRAVNIAIQELTAAKNTALGIAPPEVHLRLVEIEKATRQATTAVQELATASPDTLAASFETIGTTLGGLRQRLEEFGSEQHRVLAEPPAGLLESFASLSEALGTMQTQLVGVDGATLEAFSPLPPALQEQVAQLTITFGVLRDRINDIVASKAGLADLPGLIKQFTDTQQQLAIVQKDVTAFSAAQQKADVAIARLHAKATASRVDDLREALQKEHDLLAQSGVDAVKLQEHEQASIQALQRATTEETAKELEKQQREYERFGQSVQRSIGSTIFDVLTGRIQSFKDLLGTVKDAFLRMLADMAAAAATKAIFTTVLPALLGAAGSLAGSLGLGGFGGSASGLLGGGSENDLLRAHAASGAGAGSTLGTLSSLVGLGRTASSVSGYLGGPTFTSIATGLFGGGSSAAAGTAGFAALEAGTAGTAALTATTLEAVPLTAAGAQAAAAANATATGGGAAGTAAAGGALAAGGTILAGVGTGIATGLTLRQINDLIGLTDVLGKRGSSALAGAGGGAAAGALIGSVFPGIGTAIGAGIGALVGALGGGLFGGGKRVPKPELTLTQATAPLLSFTEGKGLSLDSELGLGSRSRDFADKGVGVRQAVRTQATHLFDSLVGTLQQFPEAIQQAAVPQLQSLSTSFEATFANVKFKGKDIEKQVTNFVEKVIPQSFNDIFSPFLALLQKVAPLLKDLDTAIVALEARQVEVLGSIHAARQQVTEALFTPAQLFETRKDELAELLTTFRAAPPTTQIGLIPQVTAFAQEVFRLGTAQEVFGDDREAVRSLQNETLGVLTELETTTRSVFTDAISATQQQIDILLQGLTSQQNMEALMTTAVAHLASLVEGPRITGSFQTTGHQVKQIPATGLALMHSGEFVSRQYPGSTTFAPVVQVSVTVEAGSDGHAIGEDVSRAIYATMRQLDQKRRYRQDKGL